MASSEKSTCDDHPEENLSDYCVQCERPICIECLTDKHNDHKVTKLSVKVARGNIKLTNQKTDKEQNDPVDICKALTNLQNTEETHKQDIAHATEYIDSIVKDVKTELDTVKAEVGKMRAVIMQKLVHSEPDADKINDMNKDFEELKRKYKKKGRMFKGLLFIFIAFIGFLFFLGKTEVSYEKPAVMEEFLLDIFQLTYNFNLQFLEKLKTLSYLRKTSLTLSLPEIVASFQSGIKDTPCICTTSDGHAWIGGDESRELILVDSRGIIYYRWKVRYRARNLAILTSGDIIIKPKYEDSSSIIRLRIDGTEKVVYGASPYGYNGVSVTSDERILICSRDGSVMACNSDGTNVKEIYKNDKSGHVVHAIELPDKTICFSDWSVNGLVLINKNGQQIITITRPLGRTNYHPVGLAHDRMGNILSADWNNHCVYIIDKNRQVKELVGPAHGIKRPGWIDTDKDDKLWIANQDGTITVVKYLT